MSDEKYAPRRTALHNNLQNNSVTEAIQTRRSVRQFTDQHVSLVTITEVIRSVFSVH